MNSVSNYHRQYLPTRNRFLSPDRSFHRRHHARNGFLGSPSPIFLRFREERDDTRGIPSYPSGINSGLRSSPLTSSIQLKPSPFTSRNKDKRQNGFKDVLASPLKGITPPRPRHLGFATPLSSSSRRHDHFSPFFSPAEFAHSSALDDTFYGSEVAMWNETDPLGLNGAISEHSTPLKKKNNSSTHVESAIQKNDSSVRFVNSIDKETPEVKTCKTVEKMVKTPHHEDKENNLNCSNKSNHEEIRTPHTNALQQKTNMVTGSNKRKSNQNDLRDILASPSQNCPTPKRGDFSIHHIESIKSPLNFGSPLFQGMQN